MLSNKSTFIASAIIAACAVQGAIAQEDVPQQGLPLQQISLFSSGVGYFQRSGTVDGAADVQLYFERDGLNDVLKSLITADASGKLRPVTYSLPELLKHSQGNDLPLQSDQSLGSILRQFQGTDISISAGDRNLEGQLLSIVTKETIDKNGNAATVEIASVLTDDGLQTINLDELQNGGKVLLRDAALNRKLTAQLRRNAGDLSQRADSNYLPVTLHFDGKGKRKVSAGYVQGTAVWKTSYRLAFDAEKSSNEKDKSTFIHPLLQGWAIVENTTNEDWNDVALNLIAGTPVSFTMNMSAPLYVTRQNVPVPFGQTLQSQVYKEDVKGIDDIVSVDAANTSRSMAGPQGAPVMTQRENAAQSLSKRDAPTFAAGIAMGPQFTQEELERQRASAAGGTRGELFEYAIDQPLSLKRGEASMIPIVSQPVDAKKFSIFDTSSNDSHAVNGLQLTNTTKMHLAGGPLTIYEDGTYAGDAQITELAPKEERLISYSLDSDLVIAKKPVSTESFVLGMTIKRGVLTINRKEQRTLAYDFRNKSDKDKTVLVLAPIREGYKLIKPEKPDSQSKDNYRFEVNVPASGNADFETISEHTISQTVALLNQNTDSLAIYSREKAISSELRVALQKIVQLRNTVDQQKTQRTNLEKQIKEVSADQNRIRSNMNSLPRDSDLYKTYMAKLSEQESKVEDLQRQAGEAQEAEIAAQRALSDYVQSLDIE